MVRADAADMEAFEIDRPPAVPPAEAFRLLADETRVAILRALYDAGGPEGPGRLAYADLMDAVGLEDSGKFNYHLSELRGPFVRKTGTGYGLRRAGAEACRLIARDLYREPPDAAALALSSACELCDGTLELRYDGEWAKLVCAACGNRVSGVPMPPGAVDGRDRDALLDGVDRRVRQWSVALGGGVCVHCGGDLDGGLYRPSETPVEIPRPTTVHRMQECRHCGGMFFGATGGVLLTDPGVVAFHLDHGVDVDDRYHWAFPFFHHDDHLRIVDADPLTVAAELELDGDVLRLEIDRDLAVRRTD